MLVFVNHNVTNAICNRDNQLNLRTRHQTNIKYKTQEAQESKYNKESVNTKNKNINRRLEDLWRPLKEVDVYVHASVQ